MSSAVPARSAFNCVSCGVEIDPSEADLVGAGYRCQRCSVKASINELQGRSDVGDHLTDDERTANAKKYLAEVWLGIGSIALGIALFALTGYGKTLVISAGGIAAAAHGYHGWSHNVVRGR